MARAILGAVLIAALVSTTGAVGVSAPAAAKDNTGAIVGGLIAGAVIGAAVAGSAKHPSEHLRQSAATATAEAQSVGQRFQPQAGRSIAIRPNTLATKAMAPTTPTGPGRSIRDEVENDDEVPHPRGTASRR